MIALGAALASAAGGVLLASAALDALDAAPAQVARRWTRSAPRDGRPGTRAPTGPGTFASAARWACRRYDASPPGRGLAARLDSASIRTSPAQWRGAQIAAFVAMSVLVDMAIGSVAWAASIALSSVRIGGRLLLRSRRRHRDDDLCAVAAALARHLATELGSGATPSEALASVAATADARSGPRLSALLAAVELRTAVGQTATIALHHAVDDLPPGPGHDVLAILATDLELVVERGCGTAVLTRLANGIDERRHTIAEVRAVTAEIRMAALAIPSLAILCATGLVAVDPAVGTAAVSPIGAATLGLLGSLAAGATVLARRLTSAPELG